MDFVDYIESELQRREWSRSDLARKGDITPTQVTRILSRKQMAGKDFCQAIARAFNVPEEEIFRRAGILTSKSKLSPLAERAAHIVESMQSEEAKEIMVDFLESYADKSNRKVHAVKRQAQ